MSSMMPIFLAISRIAATVERTAAPPSAACCDDFPAMPSVTLAFSVFCEIDAVICSMAALDSSAAAACWLAPWASACAVALTSSDALASDSAPLFTSRTTLQVFHHRVHGVQQAALVALFQPDGDVEVA